MADRDQILSKVLSTFSPQGVIPFDNPKYSLTEESKPYLSEVWKATMGITYGSMGMELGTYIEDSENAWEDPETLSFNALSSGDPEILDAINNSENRHLRDDLIHSRSKLHFDSILEENEKRIYQHQVLENSSWGTYLVSIGLDPINVGAVVLPVLRSKNVWDAIRKGAIMGGGFVAPVEMGRVYADPLVKPIEGVVTTGASMIFSGALAGIGRGVSNVFTDIARKQIYNDVVSQMVNTGKFSDGGVYIDANGKVVGELLENTTISRTSGKDILKMSELELGEAFKGFKFNRIVINQKEVDDYLKKQGKNLNGILGVHSGETNNIYLNVNAINKSYKDFRSKTRSKAAIAEYKSNLEKAKKDGTIGQESYVHHMNKIKHIKILNNKEEYAKFILLHELHHTTNRPRALGSFWTESASQYEDRIDNLALNYLREERSITDHFVFRDGVKTKIDYKDIPKLHTGHSFDTSGSGAMLNTWAYKFLTTPFKRPMMNEKIADDIKEMIADLGSDMGIKLQKNALGVPSNFSVHIKSNTDHGAWARIYDDVIKIYSDANKKKVTTIVDYRIWGAKPFDAWMKGVNRRMVFGDFDGATSAEKKAISLFQKFWKDWEDRLVSVNMIGSKRGMINEVDRLQARIAFLESEAPIKGDINYNKSQIDKYKSKVDELLADIKADPKLEIPKTELSFYARYYNHDMIFSQREKFTSIIEGWYKKNPFVYEKGEKIKLPTDSASVRKRAEATVSKILGETDGNFEQSFAGYSSKHTRHRNLDIPNHLIWDFIEQNPISVMKNYTSRVSPEYHFKNTFGGKSLNEVQEEIYNSVSKTAGLKTAQATVKDFTAMYERIVGNVVKDPTALNQKMRQVLSDLSGLTYLGSAGFATLTDYAAIALQREAGAWLKMGFSVLDGQKISLNAKEGRYAGQGLEILQNMEGLRLVDDLSSRSIDRGLYSKVAGKAKTLYYGTNLLGPATNLAKRMEAIFRAHQIVEDSIAIHNRTATQQTIEMMAKMGLGPKEIREIATKAPVERSTDKGLYLANSDNWIKSGVSRETLDKFRYSMNAGIFNTVIMSSPADKPILMDGIFYVPWNIAKNVPGMVEDKAVRGYARIENGLMALPFAFMSYSFGAANKITASLAQNTLKNKAMGMGMAMGLAYMGLQLRYRNRPWVLENMSTPDKIARTFDYSGLAAIYSDLFYRGLSIGSNLGYFEDSPIKPKFISRDEEERPVDAALEVIGAPASLVWEYKRGAADFLNGDVNEGVKRFQRNLPFMKIWWLENYIKDIGKVVGRW